jgi:aminoglycoside 3-N-acetyltransferase
MTSARDMTMPAISRQALVSDLRQVGLRDGQVVLVHASLSRLGRVAGGAATVVAALREAISPEGTLVVPAGTASNSDSSRAHLALIAGMPADQVSQYKATMPAFDPDTTPSEGMGRIAEQIRITPGALRSSHPQSSFAALGPMAAKLTEKHDIACHLGESSPLGRLYEADAQILLLGVGYAACTAFHLAEYRCAGQPPKRSYRCVIRENGQAVWREYLDNVLDDRDFGDLGADFDQTGRVAHGSVGQARCRLAPLRDAVDFATEWFTRHRACC